MRTLLCLAALLAGCTTTPTDLGSREAKAVFQTSKPAAIVAGCLAERIVHVGAPTVVATDGGAKVFFTQMAATTALITIDGAGRVEVRTVNGLIPYKAAMAACI
jgi:hypothetical protein